MLFLYRVLIVISIVHMNGSLESCRQKFGSHEYDLNQLSDFTIFGSESTFKYILTPCGLVSTNQCGKNDKPFEPGMTSCQVRVQTTGDQFESSMGFLDGYQLPRLEFSENPQGPGTGVVMIMRNAKCNFRERFVQVTFICDKSVKKPTKMDVAELPTCHFTITVRATQACPLQKKMSGGAVFLIIFFVILIIYILGGVLYNRYRRNQTGLTVLPHLDFWVLTGEYFKDGCRLSWTFVRTGGGRLSSSSSTNYESL